MAQSFWYDWTDLCEESESWEDNPTFQLSEFDEKLRNGWDQAMDAGHFRYKLDIEDTKVLGEKNYIAQLNVKRATNRRPPAVIESVNQPFNPDLFNFTKIQQEEVLLEMVRGDQSETKRPKGDKSETKRPKEQDEKNGPSDKIERKVRNLVIINNSPLEYGHVLLVPDIDACRPQILTKAAIQMALEALLLSNHRGFRVGFNSLCALASVNHQHFHAYYLNQELYVESSPVDHVCGNLYELVTMPTKGFAFQLEGSDVESLSSLLAEIADYFQQKEIAHNLYMTRGSVFNEDRTSTRRTIRVFLWPRKKFIGLKDEAAFNVALVELAGHLPIKIRELFYSLDVEKIEGTIKEAALDDDEYNTIKQDVMKICKQTT